MKKLLMLIAVFTLSLELIAQNGGMMDWNRNSNGTSSFSLTEILLLAILFLLIFGFLVWFLNSKRKGI